MNLLPWLAGCWLAAAAACAVIAGTHIVGMRAWLAPDTATTFVQARPVLDALRPQAPESAEPPEIRVPAGRAAWFALDLPPLPQPAVLELTHPSVRSAELYLPDRNAVQPSVRGGREVPAELRLHDRFPASLGIPRSADPRTVYLRVQAPVNVRAQLVLQPRQTWEMLSRLALAGMASGFGIAFGAAAFALGRAVALRSSAYFVYCLLTCSILAAGLFITGLGEATLWPALAPWRGHAAALLACVASGLALLLAERAFSLEISAPRFGMALRALGIGFPLMGLLALSLSLPVQQMLSHVAALGACAMGMASIAMAWRTSNAVAVWLLAGFAPVVVGVAITTLAIAGAVPFAPWVLLALPVSGLLQIPFNLHGLRLLEERRSEVRATLRQLQDVAGHSEESRDEVARRLALPRVDVPPRDAGATLILLRFAGLAPGSSTVRDHDSLELERYFQAMMAAGLRPGSQVGRWSYNELLLRDLSHADDARLDGLVTSLFAQALRSDRYGIPPHEPRLRIAYVRVRAPRVPVILLARQLTRALDDPQRRDLKRIELETWED